jgi:hypothetical protein
MYVMLGSGIDDLRSFPFDVQDLNIHLTVDNCRALTPLDVHSSWQQNTGSKMVRHVPFNLANLKLLHVLFRSPPIGNSNKIATVAQAGCNSLHARRRNRAIAEPNRLDVVLLFERRQKYYVYNYFALLSCIGTASLASFAVHWRDVASRLGLDITLLLVAFAFKQELASNTPDIAYLTLLDLFTIAVTIFLFLCVLVHATIGFMM